MAVGATEIAAFLLHHSPDTTSDLLALLHEHLSSISASVAAVFLTLVPTTHAIGFYCHAGRCNCRISHLLLYPLSGGNRHVVFQLLAWAFWSVSVLAALCAPSIPTTHQPVISGAAAAGSFIAQLFMVITVLVYEDRSTTRSNAPPDSQNGQQFVTPFVASALVVVMSMALAATGSLLLLAIEYLPDAPSRALYCFLSMSCLLVGASCTHGLGGHLLYHFRAAQEHKREQRAEMRRQASVPGALRLPSDTASAILDVAAAAAAAVSGACATAASFSMQLPEEGAPAVMLRPAEAEEEDVGTPSIRGNHSYCTPLAQSPETAAARTMRGRRLGSMQQATRAQLGGDSEEEDLPPWRFFQPFVGGTAFVATQALGWTLFGMAVVCVMALSRQLVAGVAYYMRAWAISAGSFMLAANLVLGASLFTYEGRSTANVLLLQPVLHPLRTGRMTVGRVLPVVLMYLPVHMFVSAWALTFAFLPPRAVMAMWAALLVPYYIYGLIGEPAHTGRNTWPWLCSFVTRNIEHSLAFWFGSSKVISAFKDGAFNASKKYIFGFHPHGLYPTGAGFLPMMPSFKAATGLVNTITLVASVMFYVPGMREIVSWSGFRQVSRRTFVRALREKGSVMMCPGGQAELIYTYRAFSRQPEVVIYAGHKGFVRLAIEQGAELVPVLALGELLQLANGWNWPSMQRYTYKRLGFPVPYLMVGRWRVSPLPVCTPLVYVIGEPIEPPAHKPGTEVSQQDVDQLHQRFYDSLHAMFLAHKHRHPVLKDAAVRLLWTDIDGDSLVSS